MRIKFFVLVAAIAPVAAESFPASIRSRTLWTIPTIRVCLNFQADRMREWTLNSRPTDLGSSSILKGRVYQHPLFLSTST